MAMPTAARDWTAQMVRELPEDGNRYEVVGGVLLVTPSPARPHQAAITQLMAPLIKYLEPLGHLPTLYVSPSDISWAPDVLVQPDIFVVAPDEVTADWSAVKTLLLAIEVLSPSTRRHDRVTKRAAYECFGVATYWIVDHEARAVEVWHPGDATPEIVTGVLRWQIAPDAPVLEIALPELFARLPR